MCCENCCSANRDTVDLSMATADSFVQVWTELDALRQEREEAREQLWEAVRALQERVTSLDGSYE